jgi:hypothetical protein
VQKGQSVAVWHLHAILHDVANFPIVPLAGAARLAQ